MTSPHSEAPAPQSSSSVAEGATPAQAKSADPVITQSQATEILAELKIIKQRLLWVLVIVGFFAARALFFHY